MEDCGTLDLKLIEEYTKCIEQVPACNKVHRRSLSECSRILFYGGPTVSEYCAFQLKDVIQ